MIQASSQTNKNNILFDAVKEYATGHEVINFGCFPDDIIKYSYIVFIVQLKYQKLQRAIPKVA